jgi:hypothetical protein
VSDTVSLSVDFDADGNPTRIWYFHTTFGAVDLTVEGSAAVLDLADASLTDRHLIDEFDRPVTTGDVLRSVEQLPFIQAVAVDDGGEPA